MSNGWFFRYLDKQQNAKQSRLFSTKELALAEACSYSRQRYPVTSLEGPGVRMTGADVVKWCRDHKVQLGPRRRPVAAPMRWPSWKGSG